jgi:CheY-like chemotaxis protein
MAVVLVVNDDHDMLGLYEVIIREIGYEVVTETIVESGPAAVSAVRADALVVDLRRPDEVDYGLRLIEEVRADPEVGSIPIILCTGAVEQIVPLLPRLKKLKVPVLPKPFHASDLERTLASALQTTAS